MGNATLMPWKSLPLPLKFSRPHETKVLSHTKVKNVHVYGIATHISNQPKDDDGQEPHNPRNMLDMNPKMNGI